MGIIVIPSSRGCWECSVTCCIYSASWYSGWHMSSHFIDKRAKWLDWTPIVSQWGSFDLNPGWPASKAHVLFTSSCHHPYRGWWWWFLWLLVSSHSFCDPQCLYKGDAPWVFVEWRKGVPVCPHFQIGFCLGVEEFFGLVESRIQIQIKSNNHMQCRCELCNLQNLLHPSHNLILLATQCHILGRHCHLPLTGEDMGAQRGCCGLSV